MPTPKKPKNPQTKHLPRDKEKPIKENRKLTYKFPGDDKVMEAIDNCKGVKFTIAKCLGINRTTLDTWLERPVLKAYFEKAVSHAVEFAESKLFELIEGVTVQEITPWGSDVTYKRPPCVKAIQFYLKTQGKTKGYVEKVETEHSGKIDINQVTGIEIN